MEMVRKPISFFATELDRINIKDGRIRVRIGNDMCESESLSAEQELACEKLMEYNNIVNSELIYNLKHYGYQPK